MCLNQKFLNNYIEKLLVMEEVQSATGISMDYSPIAYKFFERLTGQQLDLVNKHATRNEIKEMAMA